MVPALVVGALILLCTLAVLWVEAGHYTFAVDDPYIHLALAKNIFRGHYGINPGEFSAPSSSLIWPFLMAPFAALPFAVAVPVLFNALCAFGSVSLFAATADALIAGNSRAKRVWVIGLSLAFAVGTNQVGLALLGMEHSLQVLCAVWLITLVIRDSKGLTTPPAWTIAAAIAAGPLVRYEMVGPSLLVALYFVYRRRTLPALLGLLIAFAALGAFSLFLLANGQGALPTSVLAKSGANPGQRVWQTALGNVVAQLHSGWAVILAFFGFGALLYRSRKRIAQRDLPSVALLLCVLLGHLLVGRSGWFGRYEAYALAITYLLALAIFADKISEWALNPPSTTTVLALVGFAALLSVRYAVIVVTTPLGALNVYQQQAQVARFVSDYYQKPVGVNDLGYVAWQSNHYVLDFVGLASREAFLARTTHEGEGGWVVPLAAAHDVHFAAIYDEWFHNLPGSWLRCGWLHLGSKRLTAAGDTVAFYALDPETRATLKPQLAAWALTLPPNVRFEFAEGCH